MEPLTLIIFRFTMPAFMSKMPEIAVMYENSYNCGWLVKSDTPYIIKWGNCKNKESVKSSAKDTIKKQGPREVIFYDKKIPIEKEKKSNIIALTSEIYNDILNIGDRW